MGFIKNHNKFKQELNRLDHREICKDDFLNKDKDWPESNSEILYRVVFKNKKILFDKIEADNDDLIGKIC